MTVLVEPVPIRVYRNRVAPLPSATVGPAHRAKPRLRWLGILPLVGIVALAVAVALTWDLWAAGAVITAATPSAFVVRRHRRLRAWNRELELACGVHQRRALSPRRVL